LSLPASDPPLRHCQQGWRRAWPGRAGYPAGSGRPLSPLRRLPQWLDAPALADSWTARAALRGEPERSSQRRRRL